MDQLVRVRSRDFVVSGKKLEPRKPLKSTKTARNPKLRSGRRTPTRVFRPCSVRASAKMFALSRSLQAGSLRSDGSLRFDDLIFENETTF
jgi:hypothetical protein